MTAVEGLRGFRAFVACQALQAVTNAFISDGGRTTRHRPPPIGLLSPSLKWQLFFPLEG